VGGGQMTRLQALSRRALDNSMIRLSLDRLQCLVLLLGNRPKATAKLTETAANFLLGVATPPSVRLIGPCPRTCEEVARSFSGIRGLDVGTIAVAGAGRSRVDAVLDLIAGAGDTVPSPLDLLIS